MKLAASNPATISTLRADIVPHREMAIRRWYRASPLWYYHRRSLPPEPHCDRRFYSEVDPDLRPLCRLLHRAGLHTTPSCQGHFHRRDHFQQVWDELQGEESRIQTEGLAVTDSETGRELLFRASTFELPWSRFEDFHAPAAAQQCQGYLGILVPRHRVDLVCRLHNHHFHTERASVCFDGQLSCLLDASLFAATVTPRDPEECKALWRRVTEYVQTMLDAETRPVSSHSAFAIKCV